tara:strand:+ start:9450 stop:11984 length:2535 start_codon:yes stop_codon:yes gene_type:complete
MSEFNLDFNLDLSGDSDTVIVPNLFPTASAEYKIAFVDGRCWEQEDDSCPIFAGTSGNLLGEVLTKVGILKSACFMGVAFNRYSKRIPDWFTLDAQNSLDQLRQDLDKFKPNIVIVVGDETVKGLGLGKKTASTWRGSVFMCDEGGSPVYGRKCMIVQHPEMILKQYSFMPLFLMDLQRAKVQGCFPEVRSPRQDYKINYSVEECIQQLNRLREERLPVSMDIEGYVDNVTCISFTNRPNEAFIVDLLSCSQHEEHRLLKAIAGLCGDPDVPKILQNSLYDNFVLSYTYGIVIRNVKEDTMLSGWEAFPELPKGLGTQTSVWTEYPYYKSDRTVNDKGVHHRYCCTDSDVTLQISLGHQKFLKGSALGHYRFNVKMLEPLLYAQLRGMRYDTARAKDMLAETKVRLSLIQSRIDIDTLKGSVNVNSPKQLADLLYREKALPKQYQMEKGRRTTRLTTDVNALLGLSRKFGTPIINNILAFRKYEKIRQSLEMLTDNDGRVRCSYNVVGTETGRLSCSKSAHGTGTNLTTITNYLRVLYRADEGHEFFQCDLAGADGWTVAAHSKLLGDPKMFDDYIAGIKPAKVIALMYKHGSEVNKWERSKLVEECKSVNEEGKDGWLYFACKQVQHGSNYGLKAAAMSKRIMLTSYKKTGKLVHVESSVCQQLQDLYLIYRYPGITQWQNRIKYMFSNARGYPEMESASGHTRKFFGRKKANPTHQAAFSQEPQINTTYATNLAILNLWEDRANRIRRVDVSDSTIEYTNLEDRRFVVPRDHEVKSVGGLLIEPLHQVHDALCGQFLTSLKEFSCEKIKSYFDNELTIAGINMVIPFDGEYGPSWGELKHRL